MGSDAFEVQETPLHLCSVKVHGDICKESLRLVDIVSCIIPEIEAARPGCSLGMQSLCLLQKAIDKTKEHVRNCCESSKLYLATTGDEIVKRFENTRTILAHNLTKLQSMVPVVLGSQISEVLDVVRAVVFRMDPNEALAGKALKALLERGASPVNSVGNSEAELLQFAASALHISTQKDILIERRSLKKLYGQTKETNSKKRTTLMHFYRILKKYDKLIVEGEARGPFDGHSYLPLDSDSKSAAPRATDLGFHSSYAQNGSRTSILHRPIPPEEFKCYLSSKLMHDPVVISSGETFERSFIQNWFNEGHDTCPKTKMKLPDLSVIPNTSMRDLILKWSREYNVSVSKPSLSTSEFVYLDTSSNSISSTASANSMKDVHLQIDTSSISLGSLSSSWCSISHNKPEDSFSSVREASHADSHVFQFYRGIDDIRTHFLMNISGLPWESQSEAIQEVNNFLKDYNPSCSFVSSENFLDPLVRFLQEALDKHDIAAQKVGFHLLLTFVRASRTQTSELNYDVYFVLASSLATEAAAETLAVIEVMSTRPSAIPNLAASGVVTSVIDILDGHNREFQEAVIRILYNLSMNIDASSCKFASDWIPKLVPFLEDNSLAGTCIGILENLCRFEETRVAIAETNGCFASIINLLETASSADAQERAVGILLCLCTQRAHYCQLVLYENGFAALCHVKIHGNDQGKSKASEVLRLLRDDIDYEAEQENLVVDDYTSESPPEKSENKPSKTSRFSGWKLKILSKKK